MSRDWAGGGGRFSKARWNAERGAAAENTVAHARRGHVSQATSAAVPSITFRRRLTKPGGELAVLVEATSPPRTSPVPRPGNWYLEIPLASPSVADLPHAVLARLG